MLTVFYIDDIVFVFTSSTIYVNGVNPDVCTVTKQQTAKVREKRRNEGNSGFAFRVVFDSVQTYLVGFESLPV